LLTYILKRLGMMALTLLAIVTLAFFVIRWMPGSPFDDPEYSPELVRILEEKYRLHEPVPVQFFTYLKNLVTEGFWGVSFKLEPMVPVWQVIGERIPVTLGLNLLSLLLSLPLGLLAGMWAALYKSRLPDHLISLFIILFISVPSFVVASALQYFLGYQAKAFPIIYQSLGSFPERLHSLVLPVLALSFYPVASLCRYLRGELLETLSADYLLLARTKGLKKGQVLLRHAFPNSLVPLMPVIIPMFTGILSGSLVVERIFGIPGVGGLVTQSIQAGDHFLTIAVLFFYAAVNLLTVLITDLSYGLIDPRIRLGGGKDA
jgi:oligopeptide transport system permease protein